MRVLRFLGVAISIVAAVPFYLAWQLLRLVGLILWRLPEPFMPTLRKKRAIVRFKRRADEVRRRGKEKRRNMSQTNARRNAKELAGEVIEKLQARRRDIAPNVFERAGTAIRASGEAADIDALEACFTLLTLTEAAHLNTRLTGC